MEHPSDSPRESHPSCSRGSATHLTKKLTPLRIIVPPTEYCPFSTDLTLPITPLSLPTPVSSSCFTFSDRQDFADQSASVLPILLSSENTAVTNFASPTSSQFLLMPPTPHLEDADSGTAIRLSPLATPAIPNELMRSGSNGTKSRNPPPWEVSSSTWLSDLGGHTETDRIFRHNLLEVVSFDTDSSPASTPALSPSAASPSSQVSSPLAYNLPTSLTRSPASSPPPLSPYPHIMFPQPSTPARLTLKPTGTDTFPSTLDSLQAWRESVTPGIPRSEEPCSPLTEDVHGPQLEELMLETAIYPTMSFHQPHSRRLSPRTPRASRSQTLMKRAKMFGGRVKQLVTRQNVNGRRGSMDRGVSFSVVTSQDSENGSVILITAPPPPYDVCPLSLTPHNPTGQERVRSRTISEYSSAVQASTAEVATTGMAESGSGQGGGNRNALRRLSLAALSTIKRL